MKSEETVNLEELNVLCKKLSQKLSAPQLITLEGELGSGKTQFTKFLIENLTGTTPAHSPTFSIINEYDSSKFTIYHIDLYRLENANDLETTGFWDLFDEDAIIIVEWANLLDEKSLPKHWPKIKIKLETTKNKDQRKKTIES